MSTQWDAAPRDALWYGETIFERADGETDYNYGYSSAEEPPDVELLVPEGAYLLESTVCPTPGNPDYVEPQED